MRTGEITASLGGIALFVFLFFDWIGAKGDSDAGLSGWDYLGTDVTGFLVFLAAILAVSLGTGAALGRRNKLFGKPFGGPTTVLGALAFDIVVWRLFTVPPGGELAFGIFLGLIAAAAITVGGYMTLQDGGIDPLGIGGAGGSTATTRQASTAAVTTSSRATAPTRSAPAKKPAAKKRAAKKRAAKKRAAKRS
jgi:hypothetical protein